MPQGDPTDPNSAVGGASSASSSAPVWTISSRQRDPPNFSGLRGEDVEDWLDTYNRVSAFNRWDDALKLSNVGWSLHEVAKTWFFNNHHRLTTWSAFTTELRKIFGSSATRAEAAKKKLDERTQRLGESYTSYIEDVLALCHRANKDMTEESRVRHVLKGISPFAFNALVSQNPTSVNQIVTTCQRLDDLQSLRVQPIQSDSRSSMEEADLRSLIRSIIREELAAQASSGFSEPRREASVTGLRELIKQELASIVPASAPTPDIQPGYAHATLAPLPYATPVPTSTTRLSESASFPLAPASTTFSRPHIISHPDHVHPYPVPPAGTPQWAFGYPAWRPRPPRPTCFYCGIRGHVSRFCRRRQEDERLAYYSIPQGSRQSSYEYYSQQFPDARRFQPPSDTQGQQHNSRPPRRSSPFPSRRRSVSPLRPASQGANSHTEN